MIGSFWSTAFQDDELAARPILPLLPIYLFTSQTYQNFHSHEMRNINNSFFIDSALCGALFVMSHSSFLSMELSQKLFWVIEQRIDQS